MGSHRQLPRETAYPKTDLSPLRLTIVVHLQVYHWQGQTVHLLVLKTEHLPVLTIKTLILPQTLSFFLFLEMNLLFLVLVMSRVCILLSNILFVGLLVMCVGLLVLWLVCFAYVFVFVFAHEAEVVALGEFESAVGGAH